MVTRKNTLCSIVIRCYNEEEHIGRLLSGIMQQTLKNVEIIIVDSGSTDATVSIASRYPVKILSILPEEFSFGRALNIGCQETSGEFLIIVSAHVYPVNKDWLEKLITPFSDSRVALVYGKQRGNDITKYSEQQIFAHWFPEGLTLVQDHPFCNNANAAIRRSLWQKLPYNENLTGLEDLDWAKRAMESGYKIAYASDSTIIHVHNEPMKSIFNRYRREAIALKCVFPHEHFNFREFIRLLSINVISDYYHAWHDKVLKSNLFSIFFFRLMQFWGTYKGFNQRGSVTKQIKQKFYYPNEFKRLQLEMLDSESERRVEYTHIVKDKC